MSRSIASLSGVELIGVEFGEFTNRHRPAAGELFDIVVGTRHVAEKLRLP